MKKLFTLLLALCLLASFGCSKGGDVSAAAPSEARFGAIDVLRVSGGFKPTGLRLNGSSVGTAGDDPELIRNDKPYSLENVRAMFELNEWIEFSLQYEYGDEPARFGVWVFPHKPLSQYGVLDTMVGTTYFAEYELPYETYPEPLMDEFCIASEDAEAGDYDLLFTINGEIVACMELKLFPEQALEGKTQEELLSIASVG